MILKSAAIVALSALAFSLPALTGADETYTRVINGHTYFWPRIAGHDTCVIRIAWEDGSAEASCVGGYVFAYDPDGREDIGRGIGWYYLGGGPGTGN